MSEKHAQGILLPVFSLPGTGPIGTIGADAYRFIDFLSKANIQYWQMLPLNPVDEYHSPYASKSVFAGNPALVDFTLLQEEGFLPEVLNRSKGQAKQSTTIDYALVDQQTEELFRLSYDYSKDSLLAELKDFIWEHPEIYDYCLYRALKKHFEQTSWVDWPESFKRKRPEAIQAFEKSHQEEIRYHVYQQYVFMRQLQQLKKYAHSKNVLLVGDIPLYIPFDGADAWSNPGLIQTNEDLGPDLVSGAPPDAFNAAGQKWDMPVYDWEHHHETDYAWWIHRIRYAFHSFDLVRIDHFRGLQAYWAIPYQDQDAQNGFWRKGPGENFLSKIKETFPKRQFIVEDLGHITEDVHVLKKFFDHPGMKVLQFAFDDNPFNPHLPQQVTQNDVYYSGTHDNPSLQMWYAALSDLQRDRIQSSFACFDQKSCIENLLKAVLQSDAQIAIVQFQDLLPEEDCGRINAPGTIQDNWCYRVSNTVNYEAIIPIWFRLIHE